MLGYSIVLFAVAFAGACGIPNTTPVTNQTVSNANTAAPQPSPAPETNGARASNMPVTMPVVDAMFADPAFEQDLRQKLQLSDEQIQKLRDAARNAVLNLGYDEADDARSTQASIRDAERSIREIIGQEKSQQFMTLVRDRWSGSADGQLATSQPSSVPTDTRVVVNAPAYRMDVFENGRLVKSYRVGIGYPEFPLPVGLRKADTIIFNPTWTPPDEPWVKGKVKPGQKVDAGSKLNPLGFIKIPIGLPSLIHGGKDPGRLGTFASHGCVGLTNDLVQDFAVQLSSIGGKPLNIQQVKDYAKKRTETEEYKLAQPIPVELRYETIVVEDGQLKIYRDVYERGLNTEENLRRVLDSFGVSLESIEPAMRQQILDGLQKMAIDATGQPVDPSAAANANTNSNSNGNKNASSRVTRNIKGQKEVSFQIAALQGKGYPAPVNLPS